MSKLYEQDNMKIYNTDCINVMQAHDDNYFDLCVTSPPYDNLRDYGEDFGAWDSKKWEPIISELYRVLKVGGVLVWNVADATIKGSESGTSFKQALYAMSCGFSLHDTMIWQKPNPIPRSHNRYEQAFEYMFVLSKGKPNYWNPLTELTAGVGKISRGTIQKKTDGVRIEKTGIKNISKYKVKSNVWTFANSEKSFHPAVFPRKLVDMHIFTWATVGCKMIDPFMGSGTSAIASHYSKLEFVGCELDEAYFKQAVDHIKKETRQLELF